MECDNCKKKMKLKNKRLSCSCGQYHEIQRGLLCGNMLTADTILRSEEIYKKIKSV